MKNLCYKCLSGLILGLMCWTNAAAQIFFEPGSFDVMIDYNSLGPDGQQLPSQLLAIDQDDNSLITSLIVSDGSLLTGALYNVGTTDSADRALGTKGSGSTQPMFGYELVNTTMAELGAIQISFNAEQWRSATTANHDEFIDFQYSTNATALNNGTWIDFDPLDIPEILTSSTSEAAVDGNAPANRRAISATISGLTWPNNGRIFIRWVDSNDPGGDCLLALDDLQITVSPDLPEINFDLEEIVGEENRGTFQIPVRISEASQNQASVRVEAFGGTGKLGTDFNFVGGNTIQFQPNQTDLVLFPLSIPDDSNPESGKYFFLRFTDPVGVKIGNSDRMLIKINDDDHAIPTPNNALNLVHKASISTNPGVASSAEILAFDSASQRLFVSNSTRKTLEIWNLANLANPTRVAEVDITQPANGGGDGINGIAVREGVVVAALEVNAAATGAPTEPGTLAFFDVDGNLLSTIQAGALPDHVSFSPDGQFVLSANEGEPSDDYSIDPEGSITLVDMSAGAANLTQADATQINFNFFDPFPSTLRSDGVRIFGKNASVSQDLEPEYITYSADARFAYVVCQENNALAVINLQNKSLLSVDGLGNKNFGSAANGFDASDRTSDIFFANFRVRGYYQPDAVKAYEFNNQTYIVTANEGDARDYTGYSEEVRVEDLNLDPILYPDSLFLKDERILGRLKATNTNGDTDADGDIDQIFIYGGRSFSIFKDNGDIVYDSQDDFERYIANDPDWSGLFNSDHEENIFKNRSDDKGPEPEGLEIARIGQAVYAFIALERVGGLMVYNITDPGNVRFVQYVNNRSQGGVASGDLGPEDVIFVSAEQSPNDTSLVLVSNEVSSTISIYEIAGNRATYRPATPADINVTITNNGNEISWTDLAINEARYTIQRRDIGSSDYTEMAELPANTENWLDESAVEGRQYAYRVRAENEIGTSAYIESELVTTHLQDEALAAQTLIYPNPASETVQIRISLPESGTVYCQITDMSGRTLISKQWPKQTAAHQQTLALNRLAAGTYLLQIRLGDRQITQKLIVE